MKRAAALRASMLCAVALVSTPAFAQDAPQTEPAKDQDIVVTAQRRSESLQSVPVSVTAVTAEALSERNINSLTQLNLAAPSLQIGKDSNFSVRGIGTLAFGALDSSVAISIDDVNLGSQALGANLFLDVQQVEVLNGPQGLLFGKNASAGLLNIVTARPKLGVWQSITDIELANRETPGNRNGDAWGMIGRQTVNIPLGQSSALRINAIYSLQEPATTFVGRRNVRNDFDNENYGGRVKYLGDFGRVQIYAIGEYFESHGLAGYGDQTYRQIAAGSINTGPLAADGVTPGPSNFTLGGDGGFFRDIKTMGAQATASYTLDSGLEISNTFAWKRFESSQQFDTDFTSQNGANVNASSGDYDQYSNELRLALPASGRLSGQAGLYYLKTERSGQAMIAGNNFLPSFVLPNFPFCVGAAATPNAQPPRCSRSNSYFLGTDNRSRGSGDSYAAFGQLTFDLTSEFKLIAGGRVTRDEVAIQGSQNQGLYFVTLGRPGTFDATNSATNFSWKLGAQYQFTPTIMAYGTYGSGYKGPGFNTSVVSATAPLQVQPETSRNIELGLKSTFFDRDLIFNVALFHTKFSNFQVQSFDTLAQTFVIQNAAEVTSKGIELNVGLRPLRGLRLDGSATVLDTRFDDFPGAQCYIGQPLPSCAANNTFNAGGRRTPVAPAFTSNLLVGYEFQSDGPVRPFLSGNWYHRSSFNFLINQAPGARLGTSDLFGATAGFRFSNGIELALFCKNCTNKFIPNSIEAEPGDASNGKLSYTQSFGLDSVRVTGLSANFRF